MNYCFIGIPNCVALFIAPVAQHSRAKNSFPLRKCQSHGSAVHNASLGLSFYANHIIPTRVPGAQLLGPSLDPEESFRSAGTDRPVAVRNRIITVAYSLRIMDNKSTEEQPSRSGRTSTDQLSVITNVRAWGRRNRSSDPGKEVINHFQIGPVIAL